MIPGQRAMRLVAVARHLAVATAKLLILLPRWDAARRVAEVRLWSQRAVSIFGGRVRVVGPQNTSSGDAAMLVANHISWLDIYALLSTTDCRFVAKAEVRRWPVVGWLAERLGTIFVHRQRTRDVAVAGKEVGDALRAGRSVCVFPEGTTTDGSAVFVFNGAMLQPAVAAQVAVQPVAIRYLTPDGQPFPDAAFTGDMTLLRSMWQLAAKPGFIVEIAFLEPIATHHADRRAIVALARERIARHLGVPCVPATRLAAEPAVRTVDAGDATPAFWTR